VIAALLRPGAAADVLEVGELPAGPRGLSAGGAVVLRRLLELEADAPEGSTAAAVHKPWIIEGLLRTGFGKTLREAVRTGTGGLRRRREGTEVARHPLWLDLLLWPTRRAQQ
jgi:hypothetical protein